MERESFVFYKSFADALEELNDKQYAKVFRAITKFALTGVETELTGIEKAIFMLVKPQIEANNKRYENGCKGGKKPKGNQSLTKSKPNDNVNDNEERKNIDIKNTNNKCETYSDIMEDMAVDKIVRPSLWEFIKHCQLNGRTVTNDKLEDVIYELDKQCGKDEYQKVKMLQDAVRGGWYDVRRKEYVVG